MQVFYYKKKSLLIEFQSQQEKKKRPPNKRQRFQQRSRNLVAVCAVTRFYLMCVSCATSSVCETLVHPLDQLGPPHQFEGRGALVAGSLSHSPSMEALKHHHVFLQLQQSFQLVSYPDQPLCWSMPISAAQHLSGRQCLYLWCAESLLPQHVFPLHIPPRLCGDEVACEVKEEDFYGFVPDEQKEGGGAERDGEVQSSAQVSSAARACCDGSYQRALSRAAWEPANSSRHWLLRHRHGEWLLQC